MMMIETETGKNESISCFMKQSLVQAEMYVELSSRRQLIICRSLENIEQIRGIQQVHRCSLLGNFGRTDGAYLFKVEINSPAEYRDELIQWYQSEHFTVLMECSDWLGGRLLIDEEQTQGARLFALHALETLEALESSARERARSTQWFMKLAQHNWFDNGFTRSIYQRWSPAI